MNIRTYVLTLAGILTNLMTLYALMGPVGEFPPYPWYAIPPEAAVPTTAGGEWVLLPSSSGSYCLPRGFLGAHEVWRPDSIQLAQLEHDLERALPAIEATPWKYFESYRGHAPPLLTYRRQYIGVRRLGEVPVIFVNAFLPNEWHDRPGPYQRRWRRDLVCVDDGGWGYWHLEYDPAGRRVRGFAFNGSA